MINIKIIQKITTDQLFKNDEDAIEYWQYHLREMSKQGLSIKSITFSFLTLKERSIRDKLFFRHPFEHNEFTTVDKIAVSFIKKRGAFDKEPQPSYVKLTITKDDEVSFLRMSPVDKKGNIVCGYFFYPEGSNGLMIPPTSIVSFELE